MSDCLHRATSRRLWGHAGKQRNDSFCIECGLNMTLAAFGKGRPQYWKDCGGRTVALLNEVAAERAERAASKERTKRIAALRENHDWLADVTDERVLEFVNDVLEHCEGGEWCVGGAW